MAMNIYKWRGYTYQIADEDLKYYPGAELVKPEKTEKEAPKPEEKKKAPANKARKAVKNK